MYLPTDLKTIFSLLAKSARETRDFWAGPAMADADPAVRSQAIAEYSGRVDTLHWLAASL